jgi:hypothetical protein
MVCENHLLETIGIRCVRIGIGKLSEIILYKVLKPCPHLSNLK